ncbi:CopM family metallochaperone [Lichenibacterium minor]
MTRLLPIALAGSFLCGLAGAAAAAEPMTMDHGAMAPAATARTPADKAFAASNEEMMKGMEVKPSGDPDRDFVAMMLPHHRGAVEMAKVELQYGKDPELRKLAADIVKAQAVEIAQMQAWQGKRGK